MARPIVTPQAVTEIANALVAEGLEPSILAVQSRIGGGSYTTVKRYLDAWKQERAQLHVAATDTPPAIQAKGQVRIPLIADTNSIVIADSVPRDGGHAEELP